MARKIIQIAVVVQPNGPDWNAFGEIYAVADDGTLWVREAWKNDDPWRGLPALPDAKESNPSDPAGRRGEAMITTETAVAGSAASRCWADRSDPRAENESTADTIEVEALYRKDDK